MILFTLKKWSVKVGGFALSPLTFEAVAGGSYYVLGPNGSGKSTFLRSLAGILESEGGSMESAHGPRTLRFSYLSGDEDAPFPLTVKEMVGLGRLALPGAHSSHEEAIRAAIAFAECEALTERDVRSLSGGERQRVRLARALARDPEVLLLDESLSKMDLAHQLRFASKLSEWVKNGNRALFIVTHDLGLGLKCCGELLLFSKGDCVASGKIPEALTPEAFGKAYPGVILDRSSGAWEVKAQVPLSQS